MGETPKLAEKVGVGHQKEEGIEEDPDQETEIAKGGRVHLHRETGANETDEDRGQKIEITGHQKARTRTQNGITTARIGTEDQEIAIIILLDVIVREVHLQKSRKKGVQWTEDPKMESSSNRFHES